MIIVLETEVAVNFGEQIPSRNSIFRFIGFDFL